MFNEWITNVTGPNVYSRGERRIKILELILV